MQIKWFMFFLGLCPFMHSTTITTNSSSIKFKADAQKELQQAENPYAAAIQLHKKEQTIAGENVLWWLKGIGLETMSIFPLIKGQEKNIFSDVTTNRLAVSVALTFIVSFLYCLKNIYVWNTERKTVNFYILQTSQESATS